MIKRIEEKAINTEEGTKNNNGRRDKLQTFGRRVKVLELSTMVAAGSCGRMLADWGATVIKVEAEKRRYVGNFQKHFLYHALWMRTLI